MIVVKKFPPKTQEGELLIKISNKVVNKAVKRSLIRRRIKSIMRLKTKEAPFDCVVIIKPGIDKMSFAELEKEIEKQT